jgi:predicted NAD/FAD-dependent oxidoreductase
MGSALDEVLVVGGGIGGLACARALADVGVPVVVRDRGYRLGGRMAVRTMGGRPVDVGASYFTAHHPDFVRVVEEWQERELVRPWTDTFHVATPEGLGGTTTGPLRYATPLGLRSLVEDLGVGLPVSNHDDVGSVSAGPSVDGVTYAAVALAMPGPQAMDILDYELTDERAAADRLWEPCVSLVARFDERRWPELDGVFVNESPILTFVADDGRRRGDGAPVLVAHADPVLSASHLDDPEQLQVVMLDELRTVLALEADPTDVFVKRWSLAKPVRPSEDAFFLGSNRIGLCGDGWHGPSKIEGAYLSGRALGRAIARTTGAIG